MELSEYLKTMREDVPAWLRDFNGQTSFPRDEFFKSRVVYYPGSGTDGHPVKLFGGSHSAHCFVYADYMIDQETLEQQLADPYRGFRGYHTIARLQLQKHDLVPYGWIPHAHPSNSYSFASTAKSPFGFLEIIERNAERDDNYGAHRLAILFLGADGIASYDALFCQEFSKARPFAVLLHDHGFGGNYDKFGKDGLLSNIANQCNVFPELLFVAQNTTPWENFSLIEGIEPDAAWVNDTTRYLYRRDTCD